MSKLSYQYNIEPVIQFDNSTYRLLSEVEPHKCAEIFPLEFHLGASIFVAAFQASSLNYSANLIFQLYILGSICISYAALLTLEIYVYHI